MKLKIMCDSTTLLKDEYIQEHNIDIIALNVIIDGESFKDRKDITLNEVMDKFYAGSKVSSSQPSPIEFQAAFEKAKDEGYTDVICFAISSTLSGTYNSAMLAKDEVKGINIHIVDTLTASIGAELIVHNAIEYLKDNSIEDTLIYIERLKSNSVILLNMDNLTALKKSGRITRIKAAIGNLIRVKPILEYVGGKLSVISKFRTETAVFSYVIERITDEVLRTKSKIQVYLGYIDSPDKIEKLKELLETKFYNIKVSITGSITPVIGVNVGYGGYGVAWCYE